MSPMTQRSARSDPRSARNPGPGSNRRTTESPVGARTRPRSGPVAPIAEESLEATRSRKPAALRFGREEEGFVLQRKGLAVNPSATSRLVREGYAAAELNDGVFEGISKILGADEFRLWELQAAVNAAEALRAAGSSKALACFSSTYVGSNEHFGVTDKPRYQSLAESMIDVVRRPVVGSHYHGEFPDIEERVQARWALSAYEGFLVAMCAGSPFVDLEYSGRESSRIALFSSLETVTAFPRPRDLDHHISMIEEALALANNDDPTKIHAFTRACSARGETKFDPKSGNGQPTVEMRTPDNALTVDDAVLFSLVTAGLMSRTAHYLETGRDFPAQINHGHQLMVITQAARVGMNGTLVDPFVKIGGGTPQAAVHKPAWEVAEAVFEEARSGLGRIEKLSPGIAAGSLTGEFDVLSSAFREQGTGAQRVRALHDRIHAAQRAKGVDVPDLGVFYKGRAKMHPATAETLTAALIWTRNFGSLTEVTAQRNAHEMRGLTPHFPRNPELSSSTPGTRLMRGIRDSLLNNYGEQLEMAGVDLSAGDALCTQSGRAPAISPGPGLGLDRGIA